MALFVQQLKSSQYVITKKYFSIIKRCLCNTLPLLSAKRPRLLPVCHQVVNINEQNSQYFTPYPQFTREEMEEPPPRVSDEVRELLIKRRASYDGKKWIPPKIPAYQYRRKRKELIAAGHYFPPLPMRDRMLDMMPKVMKHVLEKEERLIRVEENMKIMPQWIREHRDKRRDANRKKKEEKMEQKINMLYIEKLGIHPKDPRAKELLAQKAKMKKLGVEDEQPKKKKKFSNIKKKGRDTIA